MTIHRQRDEEIRRNFTVESLKSTLDLVGREMEDLQIYSERIREQIRRVEETAFVPEVYLKREGFQIPVRYYVGVRMVPEVDEGRKKCYPVERYQVFSGGHLRKRAERYAEDLAKEYKCELAREGF